MLIIYRRNETQKLVVSAIPIVRPNKSVPTFVFARPTAAAITVEQRIRKCRGKIPICNA